MAIVKRYDKDTMVGKISAPKKRDHSFVAVVVAKMKDEQLRIKRELTREGRKAEDANLDFKVHMTKKEIRQFTHRRSIRKGVIVTLAGLFEEAGVECELAFESRKSVYPIRLYLTLPGTNRPSVTITKLLGVPK